MKKIKSKKFLQISLIVLLLSPFFSFAVPGNPEIVSKVKQFIAMNRLPSTDEAQIIRELTEFYNSSNADLRDIEIRLSPQKTVGKFEPAQYEADVKKDLSKKNIVYTNWQVNGNRALPPGTNDQASIGRNSSVKAFCNKFDAEIAGLLASGYRITGFVIRYPSDSWDPQPVMNSIAAHLKARWGIRNVSRVEQSKDSGYHGKVQSVKDESAAASEYSYQKILFVVPANARPKSTPTPSPSPAKPKPSPSPSPSPAKPKTTPSPSPSPEKPKTTPSPSPSPEKPKTTPSPSPSPEKPKTTPSPSPSPEKPKTTPSPSPSPAQPQTPTLPKPPGKSLPPEKNHTRRAAPRERVNAKIWIHDHFHRNKAKPARKRVRCPVIINQHHLHF